MNPINLEKFVDVPKLDLAVFSTFAFEPEYFEYRLLRQSKLGYARRILVLMDQSQYTELLSLEIRPRNFNRRYLVVPVSPKGGGVFHPKLHMMVGSDTLRLACGSANLTSAGFSHNLEVATVHTEERGEPDNANLWLDAFEFFRESLDLTTGREREIALSWLEDLKIDTPAYFSRARADDADNSDLRLLHSADGHSLLEKIRGHLSDQNPKSLTVLSPFFDADFRVLKSVRDLWPDLPVKMITQERNGVVPVEAMSKVAGLSLQSLQTVGSRRLHAKMLVFHVGDEASWCCPGARTLPAPRYWAGM